MRAHQLIWTSTLTITLLLIPSLSSAQITAGPADDILTIIRGLTPGDELILDDGMYDLSSRFGFTIAGTAAAPIVIRAADGATPHFHRPNASQNIWDFDVQHVVLRGLEFSGGSAGLRVEAATSLTIEDCHIHGTADVALRMNNPGQDYTGVQILRNHIHDTSGTGEGMYLGCNTDGCRLINALIANNYVHHTNSGTVSQGDGIEIKEGSYGNVIRDNVIHDTKFPCILTYSTVGNGPANLIERNVMWNCGDHAIQSAADATIQNNIILGAGGDGIAMQHHQNGDPSNLVVVHNTILNPTGAAVSLRNPVGSVIIANNALFAQSGEAILMRSPTSDVVSVGNAGEGSGMGMMPATFMDLVMGTYAGTPAVDLYPADGSALIAAGDTAHTPSDDFDGRARMGAADIGAYAYLSGDSTGWAIAEEFKDVTGDGTPGSDGGVPAPDGGATGPDGGTLGDAGSADGGPGKADTAGMVSSGCGCHTAPPEGTGPTIALLALVLLAIRRRS